MPKPASAANLRSDGELVQAGAADAFHFTAPEAPSIPPGVPVPYPNFGAGAGDGDGADGDGADVGGADVLQQEWSLVYETIQRSEVDPPSHYLDAGDALL